MSIRLENDEAKVTMALKNKTLQEIDEIIEIVTNFKNQLMEQELKADELETLINQKAMNSGNVRVAFKRTKFHREPKYQFTDNDGNPQTWAGVGKMPLALKEKITVNGKVDKSLLADYLIRTKDSNVKYQYVNGKGFVETWDGKGTMPVNLRMLTLQGHSLKKFEVKEH